MKRREFIALLGGAAAAPTVRCCDAHAQQSGKVTRLGFLGPARNSPVQEGYYQAFLAQLRDHGFSEGQNITIEYQATNDPRGIVVSAADMLRTQPELIIASGPEIALQAVMGASGYVPIVMIAVNFDPFERGYVTSLARPGGNITGVVLRPLELAAKQLELLTQAFPDRTRLAALFDAQEFAAAERAAKSLNLELQPFNLDPAYDFEGAFRKVAAGGAQMVLILSSPGFTRHRDRIAELAIVHRLPAIFTFKHYAEAGGMMSYGVEFPPMWRRAADYVARILKGARAADLPIELAAKFELVVNIKTARAMGFAMPTSILLRADEVIE